MGKALDPPKVENEPLELNPLFPHHKRKTKNPHFIQCKVYL